MKKYVITKLEGPMKEARCGAQFEVSKRGDPFWTALVGNETMPEEEAKRIAMVLVEVLEEVSI